MQLYIMPLVEKYRGKERDFKIINVANMEVLNFVLGQTEGRPRADLPTLQ